MRDLQPPSLTRETETDADEEPTCGASTRRWARKAPEPETADDESIEIDMSYKLDTELLQTTDFQMMSAAEIVEAERAIDGTVGLSDATVAVVRGAPSGGRLSFKRTLRRMARHGGCCSPFRNSGSRNRAPSW